MGCWCLTDVGREGATIFFSPIRLGVRAFKLAQLLRFRNIYRAELVAPAIESLLGRVVQSAYLANVSRLLRFLQNPNDPLFGESFPLHLASVRLRKRLTRGLGSVSRGRPGPRRPESLSPVPDTTSPYRGRTSAQSRRTLISRSATLRGFGPGVIGPFFLQK